VSSQRKQIIIPTKPKTAFAVDSNIVIIMRKKPMTKQILDITWSTPFLEGCLVSIKFKPTKRRPMENRLGNNSLIRTSG
jgi:hypothetical protein